MDTSDTPTYIEMLFARCTKPGVQYRISGSDVSLFLKSPFSLYCKHFVDHDEKDGPDVSQELFAQYGHEHESRLMREMYPEASPGHATRTPRTTPRDRSARHWLDRQQNIIRLDRARARGFEDTINLMRQGAETLLEPQLCFYPLGMHGSPDILEKREGDSPLGGYYYIVKEIKSSRKIRRKHLMQAAFYNIMLGEIQGRLPDQFHLLNADGEDHVFEHAEYARDIEDAMVGVTHIMEGEMPPVRYGRGVFPWSNYADKVAIDNDDLSLVSGMDHNTTELLKNNGIRTTKSLLDGGVAALIRLGIPSGDAAGYVARAGAIASKAPVRRGTVTTHGAATDVFLRVEEAMNGSVYMIGTLVRSGNRRCHHTFVAIGSDGEVRMLDCFLELIKGLDGCAIRYWGSGEAPISRLIKKYHGDAGPHIRMLDLQQLATRVVAFPTYRDKLKMVAEWMGFAWRDPDADWGRSVMAYRKYMEDQTRQDSLRYITCYAEDSCAALEHVWDWLLAHKYIITNGLGGLRSHDL